MGKLKKPAGPRIPARKKPVSPKQIPHYDKCKARWERGRAERKAQFAEAQRQGKPDDSEDDWSPGARFITPDPVASAESGGDWLADQPELALDAVPFLATLRSLGRQLQDQRYLDLHHELVSSDLIDRKTGKWSRYGTTLANPMTTLMCELIEETIVVRGFTEREAIAEATAGFGFDAASFGAACKGLKRLLDAYRKSVGQKPR